MGRLRSSLAFLSTLTLLSCASGRVPAPSPSTSGRSTGSAAVRASVVLVEASGPDASLETFVSRLLSEASDSGRFSLTDARLAGAQLPDLSADPTGDRASAFRRSWPSDVWMSVRLSPCQTRSSTFSQPTFDNSTGIRGTRVVVNYRTECTVALSLVSATDGRSLGTEAVTGIAELSLEEAGSAETSEDAAAQDAARRAAKRLPARLAR